MSEAAATSNPKEKTGTDAAYHCRGGSSISYKRGGGGGGRAGGGDAFSFNKNEKNYKGESTNFRKKERRQDTWCR